jgi:hypothetical protein
MGAAVFSEGSHLKVENFGTGTGPKLKLAISSYSY